jgi:dTDP-4-amino-4,6-dideoxygalactose transaminase
MTNVAAAVGRVQLDRLPSYTESRRENAERLDRAVADTSLVAPTEPDDRTHVYHQYTVRCENRDAAASALETLGVDTGVYYPTPVNREPAYASVEPSTPTADRLTGEVLSLPVGPHLSEEDLDRVTIALAYLEEYLGAE